MSGGAGPRTRDTRICDLSSRTLGLSVSARLSPRPSRRDRSGSPEPCRSLCDCASTAVARPGARVREWRELPRPTSDSERRPKSDPRLGARLRGAARRARSRAEASARVGGVQPKCKQTFFWGGWQKIVAQIRGVFRKIIIYYPPGGPENTYSHRFLSSHR